MLKQSRNEFCQSGDVETMNNIFMSLCAIRKFNANFEIKILLL